MNASLDAIAIRVRRGGKWCSKFIGELDDLTEEEIAVLPWGEQLRDMLRHDPAWEHAADAREWRREKTEQ